MPHDPEIGPGSRVRQREIMSVITNNASVDAVVCLKCRQIGRVGRNDPSSIMEFWELTEDGSQRLGGSAIDALYTQSDVVPRERARRLGVDPAHLREELRRD